MELYDKLNSDPRIENCHPRFILWDGKKHVLIATADGENVYLTPEGRDYVKDEPSAPKRARTSKKAAEVVESTDELAALDDLDVDD